MRFGQSVIAGLCFGVGLIIAAFLMKFIFHINLMGG